MKNIQYYKNQLNITLVHAAISFVVFTSIFAGMMSNTGASIMPGVLVGIFYSGVPSGWPITHKVFGGWIATGYIEIVILEAISNEHQMLFASFVVYVVTSSLLRYYRSTTNKSESEVISMKKIRNAVIFFQIYALNLLYGFISWIPFLKCNKKGPLLRKITAKGTALYIKLGPSYHIGIKSLRVPLKFRARLYEAVDEEMMDRIHQSFVKKRNYAIEDQLAD